MMKERIFKFLIALVAILFTILFSVVVVPPLIKNPDIINGFAAGFANPFASGFSADVISCWFILAIWIIYESKSIRHGWVCIILGIVPGVAVGFAAYLILRMNQLKKE